jgi:hypothetical protein
VAESKRIQQGHALPLGLAGLSGKVLQINPQGPPRPPEQVQAVETKILVKEAKEEPGAKEPGG